MRSGIVDSGKLPLAVFGKKAQARGGAVAFVFEEVLCASERGQVAEVVEWLGDIGAS